MQAHVSQDDGITMAELTIDDRRYSFCIDGFPTDKHEWLLKVVGQQMQEIHQETAKDALTTAGTV